VCVCVLWSVEVLCKSVCVCVCVCVSGVLTVHCVGYGEIVWYMQLNVLCVTVSLSACVGG
jgi:nitrate reductase NapE component